KGLDTVGLDVRDEHQATKLAKALLDWDHLSSNKGKVGELAQRAGVNVSDISGWLDFVQSHSSRRLANAVVNWRESMSPERAVDKAIVDVYRDAVDATLKRPDQLARARRRTRGPRRLK